MTPLDQKQKMADAKNVESVAYMDFVHDLKHTDRLVACFVEGKDRLYYSSRVKRHTPKTYIINFYTCGCRTGVERLKCKLDKEYSQRTDLAVLYFCDKDYNIRPRVNGICYTEFYSIENYYSQPKAVMDIIENVFNIHKNTAAYAKCVKLYQKYFAPFRKEFQKVNAYCYLIRKDEILNKKKETDFSDYKLSLFTKSELSPKTLNLKDLRRLIPFEKRIDEEEFEKTITSIGNDMYRGKWELTFTAKFLKLLRTSFKNGNNGLPVKDSTMAVDEGNLMASMERHAITPKSLTTYIKQRLKILQTH